MREVTVRKLVLDVPVDFHAMVCQHCKHEFCVQAIMRGGENVWDKDKIVGWWHQLPDYCPYCGTKLNYPKRYNRK